MLCHREMTLCVLSAGTFPFTQTMDPLSQQVNYFTCPNNHLAGAKGNRNINQEGSVLVSMKLY